jgi:hypothetical protein
MAEAGYGRPSDLLTGKLGDLALDMEVFTAAGKIRAAIARAMEDHPKDGEKMVLAKLKRDADAERLYEERHGNPA